MADVAQIVAKRDWKSRTEFDEIKHVLWYIDLAEIVHEGPSAHFAANSTLNGRADQFAQVRLPFSQVRAMKNGVTVNMPPALRDHLARIEEFYRARLNVRIEDREDGARAAIGNYPMVSAPERVEILNRLGDGSIIEAPDEVAAVNLMGLFAGALLSRLMRAGIEDAGLAPEQIGPFIWGHYARVEAYRAALVWKHELVAETNDAVAGLEEIKSTTQSIQDASTAVIEHQQQMVSRLNSLGVEAERIQNKLTAISEEVAKATSAAQAQLDEWTTAAIERYGLKSGGALWRQRAQAARRAWRISFWVIIALLVALPAFAFLFRTEIIDFLKTVDVPVVAASPDGAGASISLYMAETLTIVSRLLLVTAPLGFLIWAIRFLIRFNMRSQLLMDDAEQRETILETYFKMVERSVAEPKTDRAVLLEALFRALPGHGSDAPEPMNFSDILKLGTDPKK